MKGTSIVTPKAQSFSSIRKETIQIAKEIGYPPRTIKKLEEAQTQTQLTNIMIDARHEWDVDPFQYMDETR